MGKVRRFVPAPSTVSEASLIYLCSPACRLVLLVSLSHELTTRPGFDQHRRGDRTPAVVDAGLGSGV